MRGNILGCVREGVVIVIGGRSGLLRMLPNPESLLVLLAATIALNLSPGPDMLYVISRSLHDGQKAGVVSSLGIGAGTLVHTLITAGGVSVLLVAFPIAYDGIRYGGAVYLIYLGVKTLFQKKSVEPRAVNNSAGSLLKMFYQGVLTNVLNPKVALFFLAFLPQFVDPAAGSVAFQITILGLIFDCSGTSWNILIAVLASRVGEVLQGGSRFRRIATLLPGFILVGLGALLVAIR